MSSNEHPLRLPSVGATMDVSGLFGIERGSDGLFRAIGPQGRRAGIGVSDAVAQNLAAFWQPGSEDLAWMRANGEEAEALNEAFQFPGVWDRMAPGEIENAFMADYPDILTMCIPDIVAVRCLGDGLFHLIDEATDEESATGVRSDIAAAIIKSWGGLAAAADHAKEYHRVGSVAAIMSERWDFEALSRGSAP